MPAYSVALACGLLALATAPQRPQSSHLERAQAALRNGDNEAAGKLVQQYLRQHAADAQALVLLAEVEMAGNDNRAAYATLRRVLRADPDNVDALYFLGLVSSALSTGEYQRLYALAPDSFRVHQLMAKADEVSKNDKGAEEEYRAALRVAPDSGELLDAFGDFLRNRFRFEEAGALYSRALERNPRDWLSTYGLGDCALRLGQTQRAIELFERAVALDRRSAVAHMGLGTALFTNREPAKAIGELETAVTLEPKMREGYTLLARAYRDVGEREKASVAVAKATELAQQELHAAERQLEEDPQRPVAGAQRQ